MNMHRGEIIRGTTLIYLNFIICLLLISFKINFYNVYNLDILTDYNGSNRFILKIGNLSFG